MRERRGLQDYEDGNAYVTDQTLPSFEDDQAEVAKVEQRYESLCAQITTATTTLVSSTPGYLDLLVFGGGTFGDVTIYDETTATGTPVFTLTPAAVGHLPLHWNFKIGCTIVTAAATRITPMGRKS